MQNTKLLIIAFLLCSYGFWSEVRLTKELEYARSYVLDHKSFAVSIVEILQQSPTQVLCIADLVDIDGSILVKFPGQLVIQLGDTLEISGKAEPNLNQELTNFYRLKEIVAKLSVSDFIFIKSSTNLSTNFYDWRNALTEMLQNSLNYTSGALLAGILWGDSSHLPKSVQADFRSTGLTHVMAVSGANMTLLAQMLSYLLFFLPIRVRNSVIILAMIFFCGFVGMSAAVLRAGGMALISGLAVIMGKKYWAVGAFNIVVLLTFLYNPAIIFYDIGFQLSCAATLGLIFLQPILLRYLKFIAWKGVRDTVATTLSASIVTLPITLHYFSTWYPLSIIINILFLPIVGIISMVMYMATPLLYFPFISSIVSVIINLVVAALLQCLRHLAELSSRVVVDRALPVETVFLSYSVLTFWVGTHGGGGITSRVNKDLGKGD